MVEDNKDVQSDSSPELEAALEGSAPSTEQQTPETETSTPQQDETQEQDEQQTEEQRIPYSRFKEKVDETNWLKDQLSQQLQQRQQPVQQPLQQQAQDPYAGMTPEERVFLQGRDSRAEEIARKIIDKEIRPIIDAGRMEMARMNVAQFRQRYSDVKPESQEELAIAQKIQSGYTPDDAYLVVMGPNKMAALEARTRQQTKSKTQQKRQANVETAGVTPAAQTPPNETFEDELRRRMKEEGL